MKIGPEPVGGVITTVDTVKLTVHGTDRKEKVIHFEISFPE
jgi:hypothetical protein